MDKIQKFVRKLSKQQRKQIHFIIERILSGNISSLDVKKLQGRDQEFRIRKGDVRIIFRRVNGSFDIMDIQLRGSKTYR